MWILPRLGQADLETARRIRSRVAVKRVVPGIVVLLTVLSWQGVKHAEAQASAVSGVVRDAHGTPQMGALVELLTADATSIATSFTDDHGRYRLDAVLPGTYRLRASAAFFLPAMQSQLRLRPGVQAVINLTMSTLYDAANWLPAQPRRADEPGDDWKWTLRSSASRPLLRLVDPDTGEDISSSQPEGSRKPSSQMHVAVMNGDGTFGGGGLHQVFSFARSAEDSDIAVFQAEIGDRQTALPAKPSTELSAGYETRGSFGRSTRLLTSFQSHPELTTPQGGEVAVVRLGTTQQFALGDAVLVDAGTLLRAERILASRLIAEPFVRVSVHPEEDTVVTFRYATGRTLQSSADLDRLKPGLEIMADQNGRPISDAGRHLEVAVDRKLGSRTLSAAIYADNLANIALTGSGQLQAVSLVPLALLSDPSTGTFRVAVKGLSSQGISVALAQGLPGGLTASAGYDLGKALVRSGDTLALASLNGGLQSRAANSANISVRGKVLRSGTAVDAEYRWQPRGTLTQVNAFNTRPEHAFLSLYVKQRLQCGRLLPNGLDAVIEATNLLAQGYQPVVAPDGTTLYLAQVPRGIQGGLAFTF